MNPGATTLREIYQQPAVWAKCLGHLQSLELQRLVGDRHPETHEWIFVGCGTSYYLAQAAAHSFTALTGRMARAVPASEILLKSELVFPTSQGAYFPVLISRSGHTSEILQVGKWLQEKGVDFLGITCDGRELLEMTPRCLKLPVLEESTVMTSSFTSMLMALQFVAAWLMKNDTWIDHLHVLPGALANLLDQYGPKVAAFAEQNFEDIAILAQGGLYPIAEEVALKVMESSASYAQFFHTLEFRHGPKSIVTERALVGALLSESSYSEESAVLVEMKGLGARTLAIANTIDATLLASCDLAIELKLPVPELARLMVYVVWGQLLGSYVGIKKGLDPDNPPNLSRVVTLAGGAA